MIGLGDATLVDALTVTWPTSRTTQTFRDLAADQAIEITEGAKLVKGLAPAAAAAGLKVAARPGSAAGD